MMTLVSYINIVNILYAFESESFIIITLFLESVQNCYLRIVLLDSFVFQKDDAFKSMNIRF